VSESCVKHPMVVAEFACSQCGHDFCTECVVFPYGLRKPPVCITCALDIGGVSRRTTGRPKLSRREIRQKVKERSRTTVTRSEVRTSGLGAVAEVLPSEDDQQSERWMDGASEPEEFPGGWKQTF